MKRSPMPPSTKPLQRYTPLKSAAFKRVAGKEARAVASLKRRGPKMTPIRASARGEDCTLMIPTVCNFDQATVVLCHSNQLADGKGAGRKAPDTAAAYGCSACHDVLDGRRPRPAGLTYEAMLDLFQLAVQRTHKRLRAKGLLK